MGRLRARMTDLTSKTSVNDAHKAKWRTIRKSYKPSSVKNERTWIDKFEKYGTGKAGAKAAIEGARINRVSVLMEEIKRNEVLFASIKSLDPELYVVIDKFGEVRFSKSKHGAFMIAGGVPRMVPLTVGGLLKMLGPQLVEVKDKLGNKFRIHLYGLDWVIEDSKGKLTKIPSKELDMKKTGLVETKAGFVFHLATTSGNSQFSFNVTKKDGDKIIAKWLKG